MTYLLVGMVSTGKLRLLSTLYEDSIERFEPTIDKAGQVEYTDTQDSLTRRDGTSVEALNVLTEKGLLDKAYTNKVYICPSCQAEGMQYITACPSCDSTHSIPATFLEHEHCGYTAKATKFEVQDNTDLYRCPDCEDEFDSSEGIVEQKYVCKQCNEFHESLSHRLWCLECRHYCPPTEATEQTLYEYKLTKEGKNWYSAQTEARKLLVDKLEVRGLDVHVDTDMQVDDGEQYSVHIYAEDDLLDQQIVVDVHSTVNTDKIQYISTAAQEIGAQPLLLTTTPSIPSDSLHDAHQHNVTVLRITQDGSIKRYDSVDDARRSEPNIIDRLSSAVGLTS